MSSCYWRLVSLFQFFVRYVSYVIRLVLGLAVVCIVLVYLCVSYLFVTCPAYMLVVFSKIDDN